MVNFEIFQIELHKAEKSKKNEAGPKKKQEFEFEFQKFEKEFQTQKEFELESQRTASSTTPIVTTEPINDCRTPKQIHKICHNMVF